MKIKFAELLLTLVFLHLQPSSSNVIFRFSLGFGIDGENSSETFNKTLIIEDNGITIKDNTEHGEKQEQVATVTASWIGLEPEIRSTDSPVKHISDVDIEQFNISDASLERYNALALEQLPAIREAMFNLNTELIPLVGRNDQIAAKVKLITRYLNELNEILMLNNNQRLAKMQALDSFLDNMESIERTEGHANDVEKLLMQLLLSKHGLTDLRSKVRNELNFIENRV